MNNVINQLTQDIENIKLIKKNKNKTKYNVNKSVNNFFEKIRIIIDNNYLPVEDLNKICILINIMCTLTEKEYDYSIEEDFTDKIVSIIESKEENELKNKKTISISSLIENKMIKILSKEGSMSDNDRDTLLALNIVLRDNK